MYNLWSFLQQTVAASLVAVFLLALKLVFLDKLSPRWQYWVWGVLVLRLMVPVGFFNRRALLDGGWAVDVARVSWEQRLHSALSSPWALSRPASPIPLLPAAPPQSVTDWLFILYLAGVAATALWLLAGWWRLRGLVRGAVPVAGSRLEELRAAAERHHLPMPARVVESRQLQGPFLMGVLRPTLVLPMGWRTEESVLLHELLHLKHRDVAAGWAAALLRCIHWCNPILWLCFDRMDNDREMLCDQRVLERLEGEQLRDYGKNLLSMAENGRLRVPGATTMANGGENIKLRIRAIARFKRYPQGMGLVSGCILLALSASLVAGTSAQENEVTIPREEAALWASTQYYRATTVAGALDAYAKGMYYHYNSARREFFSRAVVAREEDFPALVREYDQGRGGRAIFDNTEYRTGPLFRGLTADGAGRWLCQVFFFRDTLPQERTGAEWEQLRYLCHTVLVERQPEGRYTVTKLGQEEGAVTQELSSFSCIGLPTPPVVWRGQAAGVEVAVLPQQQLTVQGGFYNGTTYSSLSSLLNSHLPHTATPDLDAKFTSCYGSTAFQVRNTSGGDLRVQMNVTPRWNDPDLDSRANYTANPADWEGTLASGEFYEERSSGGGCEFYNSLELSSCLCPDDFTVTLTVDGVEYPVALTREVVLP